jgi:hypothetical protein
VWVTPDLAKYLSFYSLLTGLMGTGALYFYPTQNQVRINEHIFSNEAVGAKGYASCLGVYLH